MEVLTLALDPKEIRVDLYSTAAPTGQREGILLLSHMPTKKAVRVEWSERNHDSLLRVKERAMIELEKLVEGGNVPNKHEKKTDEDLEKKDKGQEENK